MTELTTTASLVELSTLDEESLLIATLERSEIEALLAPDASHRLWFELGVEGEADPQRLTLALTDDDLQSLLSRSTGDELTLALDGEGLTGLLEEPEVEAHGMRAALALAVTTAAIAAPSALAATPEAVETSSVAPAVTSQQVGAAATTQVSRQIVRQQLVRGAAAKSQRASAYKVAQLTILRAGAVR
jgi:hypothetical protein